MNEQPTFYVVASLDLPSVYYLFRLRNNIEVKFEIIDNKIISDRGLSPKERAFIYERIMKQITVTIVE
jgi:hypothetical protein